MIDNSSFEAIKKLGYEQGFKDALNCIEAIMYRKSFEEDSDMQKWDSGCWIRYKLFENALEEVRKIED